jgi:hypothetical protein
MARENHSRDDFTIAIFDDDGHIPFDGTPDGEFKLFKERFNPF